jgi:hypothetical protein
MTVLTRIWHFRVGHAPGIKTTQSDINALRVEDARQRLTILLGDFSLAFV